MTGLERRLYGLEEILKWDEPEWLIDGFVHRGSSVFLSGPPKTGKSLFALRLGAAVSSGVEVFGHQARKGRVVFLAAERARLMKPRVKALIDLEIPIDPDNFTIYPQPVSFLDQEEVKNFAELVGPTDLLIVDTLRRCFAGGRENDNNDMTFWVTGVEQFCELTGAATIVIHHNHREQRDRFGREMETRYAGGGGLHGSLDGQFSLRLIEGNRIEVRVEGANEGNYFQTVTTTLPHQIGAHQTWVMVEAEPSPTEGKPDLEALVQEVLMAHPRSTLAALSDTCRDHEVIRNHWPNLDNTTVGRIVRTWVDCESVCREPNPAHRQQHLHTWVGEQQTAAA